MKRILALFLLLTFVSQEIYAMCGCMMPRVPVKQSKLLASNNILNKSSKVIIARNGNRTVVTMANDFKGNVKDFALVVPVPEVLQKNAIRVIDPKIFSDLEAFTAPQLIQNYDSNPCHGGFMTLREVTVASTIESDSRSSVPARAPKEAERKIVKVEAEYSVGEYDIVVLSSKESGALVEWLKENNYQIPESSREVIEPYIKMGMNFFVAKVNLEKSSTKGFTSLRPLQMSFNTDKFSLPIRFGMGNAEGDQDMVVYAMSRNGGVEATNYRTVDLPTNKTVPEFIESKFPKFYDALLAKTWEREGKNILMREYAGYAQPIYRNNQVIYPYQGRPYQGLNQRTGALNRQQIKDAGVFWTEAPNQVFITRLRVRYNRQYWPQDLMFQETASQSAFQANYRIQGIAEGPFDCGSNADQYLIHVSKRRQKELHLMANLTGWGIGRYASYPDVYRKYKNASLKEDELKIEIKNESTPVGGSNQDGGFPGGILLLLLGSALAFFQIRERRKVKVLTK